MSLAYLYLWPQDNPSEFLPHAQRFTHNYMKYDAGAEHKLYACACGPKKEIPECLERLKPKVIHYKGGGWDLGAAQFCAKHITEDFMVTGTARHYPHQSGYLGKMADAFRKFGDNLYAGSVSLEACPIDGRGTGFPNPSIRTAFYGLTPKRFLRFPYEVTNRERGFLVESGEWNLAKWFWVSGLRVIQVTWTGCYEKASWPHVPNTFRKGDQSNLLVRDKHTELWQSQPPNIKAEWAKRAWG